jgi:peptidoglycan/LPS O-acetylase OafA/YrhL
VFVRRAIQQGLARPREPSIEGFRGVVVSTVLAYHLLRLLLTLDGGSWGTKAPAWLWWAGTFRFAVDAFFVLAGMFVTASWLRARRQAGPRWVAARDYVARRARRILPPFWAAAAVFGAAAYLAGRIDLGDVGLLAITQQYLDPDLPGAVDLPMWSLTTEVQFYVVAPIIAVVARFGRGVPLLAVTLATSTWWAWWPDRVGDLAASLLPGRLDQFAVGAVAGVLVQRARDGERPLLVRAATARGAGIALVAALVALGTFHGATFQAETENHPLEYALHPLVGLVLGGLVLRLACGPTVRALTRTPWRVLGLVSYSLYLFHYPILDHGMDWFGLRSAAERPAPSVLLAVTVLLALALGAGLAGYLLFEAPFSRGLPWRLRRRSAVREPELRLQDAVEVAAAEADEPAVEGRRAADDRVAGLELPEVATVDRERRRPVAEDLEADLDVRGDDHRSVEEHVR